MANLTDKERNHLTYAAEVLLGYRGSAEVNYIAGASWQPHGERLCSVEVIEEDEYGKTTNKVVCKESVWTETLTLVAKEGVKLWQLSGGTLWTWPSRLH